MSAALDPSVVPDVDEYDHVEIYLTWLKDIPVSELEITRDYAYYEQLEATLENCNSETR